MQAINKPNNLSELDDFEDKLIAQFKSHRVFSSLDNMEDELFRNMLIQRRFFSLTFTLIYDLAIDGIISSATKDTARRILREEYPRALPSHRELLLHDLVNIGVSREKVLEAQPSMQTFTSMREVFEIVRKRTTLQEPEKHYQIRLLTVLRFWGELLVSVEYGLYWPRLKKLGLSTERNNEKRSLFYHPHFSHDAKQAGFSSDGLSRAQTHTDRLSLHLVLLMKQGMRIDATAVEKCASIEEEILRSRLKFYNQFLVK